MTAVTPLQRVEFAPQSGWVEIIQSRLDPDWRSDEWHQADWFFVSNPNNPRTRMFPCRTPGCPCLTSAQHNAPCRICARMLKQANGDEREFARLFAEHRFPPTTHHRARTEQCLWL